LNQIYSFTGDSKLRLQVVLQYSQPILPGYRFTTALTQNVKLRNHFLT